MFETLGFETLTAPQAALIFGGLIGAMFGILAEITRFCFRRALVGDPAERRPALGVWLTALAAAILGTQAAVAAGLVTFASHRFLAADLPVLAVVAGGLMFGIGMVLTRGCASRLTVLSARATSARSLVLLVFAVTAHATLAASSRPLRTTLASVTLPLGETTSRRAALPGGALTLDRAPRRRALLVARPLGRAAPAPRSRGPPRPARSPRLGRDRPRPPGRLRPHPAGKPLLHRPLRRGAVLDRSPPPPSPRASARASSAARWRARSSPPSPAAASGGRASRAPARPAATRRARC
jgi:uncharacterized membrane protein YedE/YeeE